MRDDDQMSDSTNSNVSISNEDSIKTVTDFVTKIGDVMKSQPSQTAVDNLVDLFHTETQSMPFVQAMQIVSDACKKQLETES